MVNDAIARDAIQPGRERHTLNTVGLDAMQHLHKNVGGQVFGQAGVAHAVIDVAINALIVALVERTERVRIVRLGPQNDFCLVRIYLQQHLPVL